MQTVLTLALLVFSLSFSSNCHGQGEVTNSKALQIEPILHGSLVLQFGEQTIFIDPYGGAERFAAFGAPDLVLITHPHGDHLNPKTLQGLSLTNAELIAPQAVVDKLGDFSFRQITKLDNGQIRDIANGQVEAVPMYNLPNDETARHPKGWGNGYVITLGQQRIYISGDTEDIPEMRQLEDIDIAFVCMNLPYTMDVDHAADAVIAFQPAVVYPYHYRNGDRTYGDVERFRQLVTAATGNIEVRLANWY